MTYSIVKSIESMLNRFIKRHGYGKYFKMTFLDVSPFNRKEMSDAYIKAFTYGAPTISHYCAANGISQDEMDCLMFLEDDVLQLKDRFRPPANSAQISAEGNEGAGRPRKDETELSDSGEQWQETQEGEND